MEFFNDIEKIFELRKIAIIEDNPGHVLLISMTLEDAHQNFELTEYETIGQFEEGKKHQHPDLVIADLNLPDGTAIDLLKKCYGNHEFPIVVMTAQGDETSAVQVMKLGALDYIVKTEDFFHEIPRTLERVWREWTLMKKNELTEKRLIDNEARYRNLFEATTDGILLIKEGLITDANPSMIRLLKLKGFDELLGKTLVQFSPELQQNGDRSEELIKFHSQQALSEGNSRFDWRFIDINSKPVYTEVLFTTVNFFNEIILQAAIRDVSERIRNTELLLQSERKFRGIFQNSPDAIAITLESNNKILLVNDGFQNLMGFSADEVQGKTIKDLNIWSNDNDRNRMNERLHKLGRVEFFETLLIKKNGREFSASVSVSKIQIEGEPCLLNIARDIEKIKQAERKIEASRRQYKYLFDKNPQPMWVYEIDSLKFLEVNSAAVHHYGYSRSEFLQMTLQDILSPEEVKKLKNHIEQNHSEFHSSQPWTHIKKDGSEIFVEISSQQILFNEKDARLVLAKDITDVKMAEEQLHKLSRAVEQSANSVIITDLQGNIEYVNPKFEEVTGYTAKEVLGRNTNLLNSGKLPKQFYRELWEKITNGHEWQGIFCNKTKSGELYWESASISPIKNKHGEIINFLAVKEDITQRKLIEDQIHYSEKFLNSIIDQLPQALMVFDPQGDLIKCNKSAKNTFSLDCCDQKPTSNGLKDSLYTRTGLSDILLQAYQGQDVNALEIVMDLSKFGYSLSVNKYRRWFSVNAFSVKDIKSETAAVVLLMEDISNRKINEELLVRSEERFSRTFNLSPDAIFLLDEESWIIEEINLIGQQRFSNGLEVIGSHISDIFKLVNNRQWPDLINDYHQNEGQLFEEVEIHLRNRDTVYCDISARRIRLEGKYSMIMIIRDISDRKSAELALQDQNLQMIEINKKLAEYRLMALRSVMNPHFIFNCLNSIQFYIGKNEKRKAIDYLSLFSKLIRSVLNSSVDMYISLAQEIEILSYYIELELLRFDEQFDYSIDVEKGIDRDFTEVPSMLLQPYIENAIIHGLLNNERKGKLCIKIRQEGTYLVCTVEDNGVGRAFARKHTPENKKYRSLGMSVTEERLGIINQNDDVSVEIIDLYHTDKTPAGTRVILKLLLHD
ncbi:MAG: PAS domain S-box protein [Cyclobacteriaceae bacterium]|nr:PAS domain S-box protein [Cyclobacteriaceae bacterium]